MTQARKDRRMRAQERFLMCYEETVQVLKASRLVKVARSAHYRWIEEDPTYGPRFQAVCIKANQRLVDEAVRRARYGEGQIWALFEWLRVQNQISESLQGQEPKQLAEPTVEAKPVREPAKQAVAKPEFISPYRGDGWPYKVEKKRTD
jgi:hypothetical protein